MVDIADLADEAIEESLNRSIANIQRYTGISATECECGEDIPEGRRLAIPGVKLCAACQNLDDLKSKGVRRG
ncbi:TraR/DksA C4-type zinc finger protein [Pseudomonas sp. FP1740]|uniref:TraR/DksA C4-type zinc finger protein n=1 Tax=Pseudomonas sp. FP1740 TaxID=2954078 RepID=UPI002734D020|nr:TraR/DksA C4-type zinc finger protein [Pseudomonas sp. FP1740]WLG43261.1 TraR/DksA C4-type zinc finger protein [Pseudomonas sp. FP1740]